MCFGSLLKRIKSKNTEDFEDDVFVMELKNTKDSRPANLNASQSADQLLSEVGLFSWVFFVKHWSYHASNSHITCKDWTLTRLWPSSFYKFLSSPCISIS